MPVYADYGMSRSRAATQYYAGSTVAVDFTERVACDPVGWGFYLRWRTTHEAEMLRAYWKQPAY